MSREFVGLALALTVFICPVRLDLSTLTCSCHS